MLAYLVTAIPGLITTAVALRGWRKASQRAEAIRHQYHTAMDALRQEIQNRP